MSLGENPRSSCSKVTFLHNESEMPRSHGKSVPWLNTKLKYDPLVFLGTSGRKLYWVKIY